MPHQCVRCGKLIDDGSKEIITGCESCNGRLFFFLTKAKLEMLQAAKGKTLSSKDREQIEKDVTDLIGPEYNSESPVILNFESIRVSEPGKFELDLVNLFDSKRPLVYKLEEGKYMIDVGATFASVSKDSSRLGSNSKDKKKKKK